MEFVVAVVHRTFLYRWLRTRFCDWAIVKKGVDHGDGFPSWLRDIRFFYGSYRIPDSLQPLSSTDESRDPSLSRMDITRVWGLGTKKPTAAPTFS